jgi:zinc transport system permease protein
MPALWSWSISYPYCKYAYNTFKANPMTLSFISALWDSPILIMSLCAGCLASIAAGITGTYIVVQRIVFLAGSISHAVLGGMGLFLFLKSHYNLPFFNPVYGAMLFALLSSIFISWIRERYKEREDTIIAALWSTGMALGVLFISLTPSYSTELMNFLFGNVLWVSKTDLYTLAGLNALVIATTITFYKQFKAICFDKELAELQGINVRRIYTLLLCMISLAIVELIQVVGSVLVIAIMTLPSAIASLLTVRLLPMILTSVVVALLCTVTGTFASYATDLPPGALICLVSAGGYLMMLKRVSFLKKKSTF